MQASKRQKIEVLYDSLAVLALEQVFVWSPYLFDELNTLCKAVHRGAVVHYGNYKEQFVAVLFEPLQLDSLRYCVEWKSDDWQSFDEFDTEREYYAKVIDFSTASVNMIIPILFYYGPRSLSVETIHYYNVELIRVLLEYALSYDDKDVYLICVVIAYFQEVSRSDIPVQKPLKITLEKLRPRTKWLFPEKCFVYNPHLGHIPWERYQHLILESVESIEQFVKLQYYLEMLKRQLGPTMENYTQFIVPEEDKIPYGHKILGLPDDYPDGNTLGLDTPVLLPCAIPLPPVDKDPLLTALYKGTHPGYMCIRIHSGMETECEYAPILPNLLRVRACGPRRRIHWRIGVRKTEWEQKSTEGFPE